MIFISWQMYSLSRSSLFTACFSSLIIFCYFYLNFNFELRFSAHNVCPYRFTFCTKSSEFYLAFILEGSIPVTVLSLLQPAAGCWFYESPDRSTLLVSLGSCGLSPISLTHCFSSEGFIWRGRNLPVACSFFRNFHLHPLFFNKHAKYITY